MLERRRGFFAMGVSDVRRRESVEWTDGVNACAIDDCGTGQGKPMPTSVRWMSDVGVRGKEDRLKICLRRPLRHSRLSADDHGRDSRAARQPIRTEPLFVAIRP